MEFKTTSSATRPARSTTRRLSTIGRVRSPLGSCKIMRPLLPLFEVIEIGCPSTRQGASREGVTGFVHGHPAAHVQIEIRALGFQSRDKMITGQPVARMPGNAPGIPDKALDLGPRHADAKGGDGGEVAELVRIALQMEFQDLRERGKARQRHGDHTIHAARTNEGRIQ